MGKQNIGGRLYPEPGEPNQKSAGQLMKEVTEDLSNLFRKEIELAKQEVSTAATEKAKGAAVIAVAGLFGFFALIFSLLALRDVISTFWPAWAGDLIVVALLLGTGAIAVVVARKKLSTPINVDLTKKTLQDDVELAKNIGRR